MVLDVKERSEEELEISVSLKADQLRLLLHGYSTRFNLKILLFSLKMDLLTLLIHLHE